VGAGGDLCLGFQRYGIMAVPWVDYHGRSEMPLAKSEIRIGAPPDQVWAVIGDLEGGPRWSAVTLECQLTSEGPPGLGCTYRAVSKFAASKITTEHEIVEWEPPHIMVSWVTKGAESVLTQICEPEGQGSKLTMSNEFALPRGVPSLVGDKLAQQVSNTLTEELMRIKREVEERYRAWCQTQKGSSTPAP